MKLNKLALTLTAAVLLPTFAFAGTDAVVASFKRDLQHGAGVESVMVAKAGSDPLDAINVAFRSEPGIIVASFQRDLHRVPTTSPVVIAGEADPLTTAIYVALWSETGKPAVNVTMAGKHRRGS